MVEITGMHLSDNEFAAVVAVDSDSIGVSPEGIGSNSSDVIRGGAGEAGGSGRSISSAPSGTPASASIMTTAGGSSQAAIQARRMRGSRGLTDPLMIGILPARFSIEHNFLTFVGAKGVSPCAVRRA